MEILAVTKLEVGNLTTPDGTPYHGFKLTTNPPDKSKVDFSDIAGIFKSDPSKYKVKEERVDGKFKSYIVETQ